MKKLYNCNAIKNLIERYVKSGGKYIQLEDGVLGYGLGVLIAPEDLKLKSFVIKEIYTNAWESGHTVRGYNKLPKKYVDLIDKVLEEN